jgi:hypothetical protein
MGLPNVINDINDLQNQINTIKSTYLPLSGGTLTGAINFANSTWNTVGDDAYFGDCNVAGCVGIKGKNGETGVNFISKDGTTSSKLCISGSNLTINGNNVITSAGGKMSGALTKDGVAVSWRTILDNSPQSSFLYQNTYSGYTPALNLKTKDGRVGIGTYENYLALTYFLDTNTTNSANTQLNLLSNGTATIGGRPIVCVTNWASGMNGYRKYSDGLIEQWGFAYAAHGGVFNMHTAFTSTNYCVYFQLENVDAHYIISAYNRNVASFTTMVYWTTNYGTGTVPCYWYACGY